MKHFGKRLKNIFWLCRPYRKYARVYFFVILLTSALLEPIDDFFYVYFPKEIVDLLAVGKSFWYVATFSAIVCGILFIKNMTPKVLYPYFQCKSKEVELKIKRDIYKKALSIDYRYIDNPEYYNKYAWAITEYSAQTLAARDFMSKFIQHFMSVTMLFTMIAAIGPWIIPIEIIQMFLHCKIDFVQNSRLILDNAVGIVEKRCEFSLQANSAYCMPFLISLRNGAIRQPRNLKISALSNFKE